MSCTYPNGTSIEVTKQSLNDCLPNTNNCQLTKDEMAPWAEGSAANVLGGNGVTCEYTKTDDDEEEEEEEEDTFKAGNLEGCEKDNVQMKEANPELTAADDVYFSQVETVIDGDKVTIVYPKGPNGTRLLSPSLPYVHFVSSHTHTFLILDLTTY